MFLATGATWYINSLTYNTLQTHPTIFNYGKLRLYYVFFCVLRSNAMQYDKKRNAKHRKTHPNASYIAMHCFVKRKLRIVFFQWFLCLYARIFWNPYIGFSKKKASKWLRTGYQEVNLLFLYFRSVEKTSYWIESAIL